MTPIKGFPGYFITRTGEVWSERKNGPGTGTGVLHRLKPRKNRRDKGRLHVLLRKDGKSFTQKIHRLLAETFLPKPPGATLVRHLDDDVANNDLANLAWGDESDNAVDMHRNQIAFGCQKLMPLNVLWIREQRRQGATCVELAAMHRVSRQLVGKICNRNRWSHLP